MGQLAITAGEDLWQLCDQSRGGQRGLICYLDPGWTGGYPVSSLYMSPPFLFSFRKGKMGETLVYRV